MRPSLGIPRLQSWEDVNYYGSAFDGLLDTILGDYVATMDDRALLVQRLREKGVNISNECETMI